MAERRGADSLPRARCNRWIEMASRFDGRSTAADTTLQVSVRRHRFEVKECRLVKRSVTG